MATSLVVVDIPQQDIDLNLVDASTFISDMEALSTNQKTGKLNGTKWCYLSGVWIGSYWSYNWLVDSTKLTDVATAFSTFKGTVTWSTDNTPTYTADTVTVGS